MRSSEEGTVYEVSEEDRERLREPRGKVVKGDELLERLEGKEFDRCIAVGDRVSLDLVEGGLEPDITVVDGRIQRESIDTGKLEEIPYDLEKRVEDPPGKITAEAWDAVREAIARDCKTNLSVEGEEDLLALPAITYASPESVVVYGQRDTGAVILEPVKELKWFVRDLVGRERFGEVIVGGSWEFLHAGHRSIILEAFSRGENVEIGITSDSYLEDKLETTEFEGFEERKAGLESFLEMFRLQERAELFEIDDFRGRAVEEGEAIIVTDETRDSAERINKERKEEGREPLRILEVPLVDAESGGTISSSRIRNGEIDRDGLTRETT
ncbi:MAG: pantetheine-phosphate adenylyltransferase [Candidatus Nanohaloarchaeota archaeon QJJ-7]|nr:pantetheine-phosphate adenylyltransferase [Candidatus Nanohaloarchaeota archaeon QJJ-7]